MTQRLPIVKVVGVSASGKSTLVQGLRAAGYDARAVSQEHSQVGDLWKQFEVPRILIFLDNDLEGQRRRRPDVTWDEQTLAEEHTRLQEAKSEADVRINTASLEAAQVLDLVVAFLRAQHIRNTDQPLPVAAQTGAPLGRTVKPGE